MTSVKVGEEVDYHGSYTSKHGVWTVAYVPSDPTQRGYALTRPNPDNPKVEQLLRDVHPRSFTAKGWKMRDRDELLDLGYEEEYLDGIDEFVPSLLEGITDGVYDAYLKKIVAHALDRRDAILGEEATRVAALAKAPVRRSRPAPETPEASRSYSGPVLGENDHYLDSVNFIDKTFLVEGRRYAKSDFLGQVVRLNTAYGIRWYFDGVLAKIVTAGRQNVVVALLEDPKLKHPGSTELKKKMADVGMRLSIPPNMLGDIYR